MRKPALLILRSSPQGCVSKDRQQKRCVLPPFETAASRPPQDEADLYAAAAAGNCGAVSFQHGSAATRPNHSPSLG